MTKRKKYILSEETLDSILSQATPSSELNLNKNGEKGNTFLVIDQNSGELQFIIPYKFNGNFYASHIPNPSELFLKQAIEYKNNAEMIVKSFDKNIEHIYEQSKDSSEKIKMVNPEIFDRFIMHKISCLTSLIATVESLVNETIPENFKTLNNKNIEIGKYEIERFWNLKSKLKEIIPKIVNVEMDNYENLVNRFLEMNYLRNEFIHMKFKTDEKNFDPFLDYFQKLINIDLENSLEEVQKLIKNIRPSFTE